MYSSTAATRGWGKGSTAPPPEDIMIRDPNQKAGTIQPHRIQPIGPITPSGNGSPKWLGLVKVDGCRFLSRFLRLVPEDGRSLYTRPLEYWQGSVYKSGITDAQRGKGLAVLKKKMLTYILEMW